MNIPRQVYAIKHNITNHIYIGSSSNVTVRVRKHLGDLRRHKHTVEDMQADFDQYGEDYTVTILDDINVYSDKDKEYEWMLKLSTNVRGVGYNYKDSYAKYLERKKKSCPKTKKNY